MSSWIYRYPDSSYLDEKNPPTPIPRMYEDKAKVAILRRYLDEYYQENEPQCWFTDASLPLDDNLPLKLRDVVVEWNCKLKLVDEMDDYTDPKDSEAFNRFANTYAQLKIQRGIRDHEYILSIEMYVHAIEFGTKNITISDKEIDQVLELFVYSGRVFDTSDCCIIRV